MGFLGAIAMAGAKLIGGALDNKRSEKNRKAEEQRLRDATGYDFVKLRDQAVAAGFNPLTVLQNTGGAGYDGRGAVVSRPYSPFIGDALASGVTTFFDVRESERRFDLDRKRDELLSRELDKVGEAFASSRSPFGAPASVALSGGAVSVGDMPDLFRAPQNGFSSVPLRSAAGDVFLDPGAAYRLGLRPGDWIMPQDYTALLGEGVGDYRGGVESVVGSGPFNDPPKRPFVPTPAPVRNPFGGGSTAYGGTYGGW